MLGRTDCFGGEGKGPNCRYCQHGFDGTWVFVSLQFREIDSVTQQWGLLDCLATQEFRILLERWGSVTWKLMEGRTDEQECRLLSVVSLDRTFLFWAEGHCVGF